MDYKSIIGNSILGIIVACVAISAFALLKRYGWKAWKEIPTIETSGVKFYFKLLKVLVLFLTLGSGVPAIILMIVNLFGDHYGSKSGNKWFQVRFRLVFVYIFLKKGISVEATNKFWYQMSYFFAFRQQQLLILVNQMSYTFILHWASLVTYF